MCFAFGVYIVDRANECFVAGAARISEIEAALGIERQIVGPTQRLAVALLRGGLQHLAVGVEMEYCMSARIANEVRAVGKDFMTVGCRRLGPDARFALRCKASNMFAV